MHLLRYVSRKLLVIWDRAPIHRGHVVEDFLATEVPRSAIHLEPLPSYAPELNPDEWVWNQLKDVELRNLCCPNPK